MQELFFGERLAPAPVDPQPGQWRRLCPADDRQLRRLLSIVKEAHPKLVPCDDLLPFSVAFAFIAQIGRAETPDRRHYASFWGTLATAWAKSYSAPSNGVDAMVFAACHAHADVPWSPQVSGWSSALGLREFGGRRSDQVWITDQHGNKTLVDNCTPAWKILLAGQRGLLAPTPAPPLPSDSRPTQTRILGGGPFGYAREPWDSP
jgi:hypothetical protein